MTTSTTKDRITDARCFAGTADTVLQSLICELDGLMGAPQLDALTQGYIRQVETLAHVVSDYLGKALDALQDVEEGVRDEDKQHQERSAA
jgi:hypothetical protein